MSFNSRVRSLFAGYVGSLGSFSAHTYDTLPDDDETTATQAGAADVFGAYSEIAASVGAVDIWLFGVHVGTPSAATDYKIEVATGLAAAEVPRVVVPMLRTDTGTAATLGLGVYYALPFPIRITSGTRLATRVKTGAGGGETVQVVEMHALGFL